MALSGLVVPTSIMLLFESFRFCLTSQLVQVPGRMRVMWRVMVLFCRPIRTRHLLLIVATNLPLGSMSDVRERTVLFIRTVMLCCAQHRRLPKKAINIQY